MNKYIVSDVKINIRDLMRYVFRHWLVIVSITVLFGGIFAGVKAAPMFKQTEEAAPQADSQSMYDTYMGYYNLDVGTVNDNFDQMQVYFAGNQNYVNNSIFMQIDPYSICDTTTMYEIKAEDSSALAVASYLGNTALAGGGFLDPVASQFDTESIYIKELIRVSYSASPVTSGLTTNEVLDNGQAGAVILTVETMGTSKEMSEAIMDAVEAQIESASSAYAGDISFTLSKLSRVYQVTASDAISDFQYHIYDRFEKMGDILNSFKKQSTTEIVKPALSDYTSVKTDTNTVSPKAIVKFGLTGVFLGFVITCAVYVLIYVMSGKLITEDRFKSMYNINDLGADDDMIIASIRNYAQGAKKILLTGSGDTEALAGRLKGKLDIAEFIPAGSITDNAQARAKLTDCDAVILAEAVGVSRYDTINEELGIILATDKEIIGAVIR